MRLTQSTFVVALILSALGWAAQLNAGPEAEGSIAGLSQPAFDRFVPSSAGVWISLGRVSGVNEALRAANFWELVAANLPDSSGEPPPFDLLEVLRSVLGSAADGALDEVSAGDLGFAARSLKDLGDSVWFFRLSGEESVDRWIPKDQRRSARLSSTARLFRADDGRVGCYREGMLAYSRAGGRQSLFRDTMRLMADRTEHSLLQSAAYVDHLRYLPSRPLATIYLSDFAAEAGGPDPGDSIIPLLPSMKQVLLGLYLRDGRIDVAVRGAVEKSRDDFPVSFEAIEKLQRLPSTTLFAWAANVSAASADSDAQDQQEILHRVMQVFARIQEESEGSDRHLIGDRTDLVVAWDQDMESGRSTPQLMLAFRCEDARAVQRAFSFFAQRMLHRLYAADPVDESSAASVVLKTHLGVPISFIPLRAYASRSRFPAARFLSDLQPAWAAHEGWFYLAFSRAHLERVFDGQMGLSPTLERSAELQNWQEQRGRHLSVGVIQGQYAAEELNDWLAAIARNPTLLQPTGGTASELIEAIEPGRLGVVLNAAIEPGAVIVDRVLPNTPAADQLRIDDRIIGVDGRLLDLESPKDDFFRHWAQSREGWHTLRILRDGVFLELKIDVTRRRLSLPELPVPPAEAIRELAAMVRNISIASYAELATDPEHFAAWVSFRFAAPLATSEAAPSSPTQP